MSGFGFAEHVASFLLNEAFHYAHEAAVQEVAGDIFGELIQEIDLDPSWQIPEIPTALPDWLEQRNEIEENILDPTTAKRMSDAWYSSLNNAIKSGRKIPKTRRFQSTTDIVGHAINLTVCLEAVLNRHLFLLSESEQLAIDHYRSIDHAELMPKLLFCFKEEIVAKKLNISRVKNLVKLRNHSVHYRINSPESLHPSAEDLIETWRELGSVFALTHGEPTQSDIQELSQEFVAEWIAK